MDGRRGGYGGQHHPRQRAVLASGFRNGANSSNGSGSLFVHFEEGIDELMQRLTNKDSIDRRSAAEERQGYHGLNEPGGFTRDLSRLCVFLDQRWHGRERSQLATRAG